MAVSSGTSFLLSSIMTVLLFSGMQTFSHWLTATQLHTVIGGFLGSIIFMLVLTAIGNLETLMFGKTFQTKLFPEVIFCLFIAMFACGTIHRVCTTTCFIFSLMVIYYMNQLSQKIHNVPTAPVTHSIKKRK